MYVPASAALTQNQRIVEAARVLPAYGGVTGWAALHWGGGRWFDGHQWFRANSFRDVTLATPSHAIRAQSGIEVSEERLEPGDLTVVDHLPVTSMVRSVCWEMRYAPSVWLAVVALDMAAYSDQVSLHEISEYAAAHSGWTGIPVCRDAIPLASENAWSPPEV